MVPILLMSLMPLMPPTQLMTPISRSARGCCPSLPLPSHLQSLQYCCDVLTDVSQTYVFGDKGVVTKVLVRARNKLFQSLLSNLPPALSLSWGHFLPMAQPTPLCLGLLSPRPRCPEKAPHSSDLIMQRNVTYFWASHKSLSFFALNPKGRE